MAGMMYEELIKRLRALCEDCKLWDGYRCCLEGDCTAQTRLQAADAIEELARRCEQFQYMPPPAWIPVSERLPKYGTKVLVFAYGHDVLTARLCKETEFDYPVFDCNGIYNELAKQGRITHWMPLPEPPKEET